MGIIPIPSVRVCEQMRELVQVCGINLGNLAHPKCIIPKHLVRFFFDSDLIFFLFKVNITSESMEAYKSWQHYRKGMQEELSKRLSFLQSYLLILLLF